MKKPKILLFDVETTPSLAYVWGDRKYDQTVIKFVKTRELLSVAYQYLGNPTIYSVDRRGDTSDKRLAAILKDLIDGADFAVAHNGDKFDLAVARTRGIKHDLMPNKPWSSVDTLKTARKHFSFPGNSLGDLAEFLGVGKKLETGGLDTWLACMELTPNKKAWARMIKYNKHDVRLLAGVYGKLRPYMSSHPNLALIAGSSKENRCQLCGKLGAIKRGYIYTKTTKKQRWQCQSVGCGGWYNTKVTK